MTAPDWVGRVVDGRYVVEAVVGRGGMGVVLAARHKFTGARVALKMVRADLGLDAEIEARFLAEARIPGTIGHRSVVQTLDAGKTPEGELYLVMELLAGRSLRHDLMRGIGAPSARRVGMELLDVLAAAHARGIVHRDVKPENVFLVEPDASVKLLDFGITKVLAGPRSILPRTAAGVLLGTIQYMAPEQLADARGVDARADLWAVSVMLYEMLAGRRPHRATTTEEMFAALVKGEPDPIRLAMPSAPPEIDAFFVRALAREPEHRFQSAGEMAIAFARLPLALSAVSAPTMVSRSAGANATLATGNATLATGYAATAATPGSGVPGLAPPPRTHGAPVMPPQGMYEPPAMPTPGTHVSPAMAPGMPPPGAYPSPGMPPAGPHASPGMPPPGAYPSPAMPPPGSYASPAMPPAGAQGTPAMAPPGSYASPATPPGGAYGRAAGVLTPFVATPALAGALPEVPVGAPPGRHPSSGPAPTTGTIATVARTVETSIAPRRRRYGLVLGALGAVTLGALLVVVASRGSDVPAPSPPPSAHQPGLSPTTQAPTTPTSVPTTAPAAGPTTTPAAPSVPAIPTGPSISTTPGSPAAQTLPSTPSRSSPAEPTTPAAPTRRRAGGTPDRNPLADLAANIKHSDPAAPPSRPDPTSRHSGATPPSSTARPAPPAATMPPPGATPQRATPGATPSGATPSGATPSGATPPGATASADTCTTGCKLLASCRLGSTSCEADCAKNVTLSGCLSQAAGDCNRFASCWFASSCRGVTPAGAHSCSEAMDCEATCSNDATCICGCIAGLSPRHAVALLAYNGCALSCRDADCIAQRCPAQARRCRAE